ncbi:unnamed protein product, partial [Prorocentrum cordatum]
MSGRRRGWSSGPPEHDGTSPAEHQNGSGCRPHKKSAPVHVHLLTRHGRRRLAPQRASAEGTDERRVIFSGPRGVHTVALDARNSSCALARGISHGNPGATEVQKATKELKNCGARLQTASGVSGTGRPGEQGSRDEGRTPVWSGPLALPHARTRRVRGTAPKVPILLL